MKQYVLFLLMITMSAIIAQAQEAPAPRLPITVTVFSESLGLPGFRSFFQNPNLGIRVGTELYYGNNVQRQVYQTINVGYYRHRSFQSGFFFSSEIGYRKFIGDAFIDGTLGLGYLFVNSALPRYEQTPEGYQKTASTFGRLMPNLGVGAGYRFKAASVFTRYELFGEIPFGFKGLPALPHQTLHVGTRIQFAK